MKDFEVKPSRHGRSIEGPKSKPNKAKRLVGGALVSGLAALALAVGLRGGSGEYDQTTKDSLKASLKPTAVKIARVAVGASTGWERYRDGNKIIINIIGNRSSQPHIPMDVNVITGITDGRADAKKVESVSISRGVFGNKRTVYIDAPQSDNLPDSFFTGGQDYDARGAWSGSVIDLKGEFTTRRGFQMNTDDAFVASDDIDIIDPEYDARVQTADTVAAMADRLHDQFYYHQGVDTSNPAAQQPR